MKVRKVVLSGVLAATAALALAPPASAKTATTACRRTTSTELLAPTSIVMQVTGAYRYKGHDYSAVGERLKFSGHLEGASLEGEPIKLTVFAGTHPVRSATLNLIGQGCSIAEFTYNARLTTPGRITWKIEHVASASVDAFTQTAVGPTVYRRAYGFGSRGIGVSILLAMLRGKGYYAPRGRTYGPGTGKAVLAFRKVNRMARIESPSRQIYHLLQAGRGGIRARYPRMGEHLEADLSRQVLTFYKGSKALEIHPISSGKPSTPTILGKYQFYMREPGTNGHGMVYSVYFHNGYATHGYAELPTYPASHGCLRTWVPSARHIYHRIKLGEWIAVFW